jgi:alkylated DNA repair protein (DNA oxidative demethylase)
LLESKPLEIAPGIRLWSGGLDVAEQISLLDEIMARVGKAPFYRPRMPKSGKEFSVEETNLGSLGWVSDIDGYRYQEHHPVTRETWPDIPETLLRIWDETTERSARPECCLVNLYRDGAKMGLHQDRDERALDAPVLSISLGDDALFRIGGPTRKGPTKSIKLASGDVLVFGGLARLAFHGIDRIVDGSSRLVAGGGRINLTLRRVAETHA